MSDLFEIIKQTELAPVVQENPYIIETIENPIEMLQLIAIESSRGPDILTKISIISKTSQIAAVTKWSQALRHIKSPSPFIEHHAVRCHADAIRYVTAPSKKLQMIAVSKSPGTIQYIESPCEEVEMMAWVQGSWFNKNPCDRVRKLLAEHTESEKKNKEIKHSRRILQTSANPKEKKEASKKWRHFNANNKKKLTF